jgi:hypothetical protein
MSWNTLHETVRRAVAHRYDWPLPIAIVANWEKTGRTPGPAHYDAFPAGSLGTRAAVFSLGLEELLRLAPLLDDFVLLDQALAELLCPPDRMEPGSAPEVPVPAPVNTW